MNPTLSARLRRWRQDRYWRTHPSAPWPMPTAATPELAEVQLALYALVAIPAVVPVEKVCLETVCLEVADNASGGGIRRGTCAPLFAQEVVQGAP